MRSFLDRPRAWLLRACGGWRPRKRLVILTAALAFLLHVFDAFATLEVIARGGEEAWWPARAALKSGDAFFLVWKIGFGLLLTVTAALLAFSRPLGRAFWWILVFGVLVQLFVLSVHVTLLWIVEPFGLAPG